MQNYIKRKSYFILLLSMFFPLITNSLRAQNSINVVRIHYGGGGDWYGNRTTFVNIFNELYNLTGIKLPAREVSAKITDETFFNFPLAYIAGHGNVKFSDEEARLLRRYLTNGGFLWADDDYGMDKSFRREMKKVFPELEWVALPFSHPIFHQKFQFPAGLPKIHKHDGGPPQALGLFYEGNLVAFYSFNTDISDGCEDYEIHKDPPALHRAAIKMACNIILWALSN